MPDQQFTICERLKQIGYYKSRQIRMYGEQFELVSDPFSIGDHLVVVDAIEVKSGKPRRVRIPLTIIHMLQPEPRAA
jgi:hypothetical protein